MKKSILNLGKELNVTEQKEVNGGRFNFNESCFTLCQRLFDGSVRPCGAPGDQGVCDGNGGYIIF